MSQRLGCFRKSTMEGQTLIGLSGGPFVASSYDYDAPNDEYDIEFLTFIFDFGISMFLVFQLLCKFRICCCLKH